MKERWDMGMIRKGSGWRWAVLVGWAVAVAACSKPEALPEPVRSVKVMVVGVDPMQSGLEFAGEVRARTESRLGFRVGGKLVERPVQVGQRVRKGQVLARLDPQDLALSAQAAAAAVAAARTQRDLAAAEFKRYEGLRAQNFISAAELDRRRASLDAAQAQLDQAQAQAQVQSRQADHAQLLADANGVITAVLAEPGQVLAVGTPVVQLAHDGARDAVFALPEDKLARLPLGTTVRVQPWAQAQAHAGRVREVAASADPVTRTYAVKVALDTGLDWPLGSTVTVWPQPLSSGPAGVLKLPTSALRQEGQGTAVWVLDTQSMTVRSRPIQVATADGNEAVVASGLQPGDSVVVAGVHVLSAGQKVTLYREKRLKP